MAGRLREKLTYANVMATVAVFITLGGGAYAASHLEKNSVGAEQLKNGSVNGAKVKNGSLGNVDFAFGQLSARPVRRPAKGLWAVVGANGSLVRGSRVVSTKHLFTPGIQGSYQVVFNRNVTKCALIATLGRTNSAPLDPSPGEIGVAYRHGASKGVYVKTLDSNGTEADRSFHLAALC